MALLGGAILAELVGLAGIGIAAGTTRLPLLLAATIVASVLVALAALRRPIRIAVAVGGGTFAVVIVATLRNWHPDYRPTLELGAILSALSCAWAVVAFVVRDSELRRSSPRMSPPIAASGVKRQSR